jgi:outer membrane protein
MFLAASFIQARAETLTNVLVSAYKNNPEIQQAVQEAMSYHEKLRQAYGDFSPTLDLQAETSRKNQSIAGDKKDFESVNNPNDIMATSAGLNLNFNLFKGGASLAQVKKANKSIRQAWIKLKITEQKVFLETIKIYLALIAQEATIKACQANVVSNVKTREFALSKESIGEGTKTELAQAEQRLSYANSSLEDAKAVYEALKSKFTKLTCMPVPAKLEPVKSLKKLPKTVELALSKANEFNLQIIAANIGYDIAKIDTSLQGSQLLPTIDAFASLSNIENKVSASNVPNSVQDSVTARTIGLRMKVPLFEGGIYRSRVREAHEVSVGARINISEVEHQTIEALKTSWANWQKSLNNIENNKMAVSAGKVRLEGTYQAMVAGTMVILDVLDAQYELFKAEVGLVESERDAAYYEFEIMSHLAMLNVDSLKIPVEKLDLEKHYEKTRFKF